MALTTLDAKPALIVIDFQKGIVDAHGLMPPERLRAFAAWVGLAPFAAGSPVLVNVTVQYQGVPIGPAPEFISFRLGRPCRRTQMRNRASPRHQQRRSASTNNWARDSIYAGLGVTQVVLTGISTPHGGQNRVHRPLRVRLG